MQIVACAKVVQKTAATILTRPDCTARSPTARGMQGRVSHDMYIPCHGPPEFCTKLGYKTYNLYISWPITVSKMGLPFRPSSGQPLPYNGTRPLSPPCLPRR